MLSGFLCQVLCSGSQIPLHLHQRLQSLPIVVCSAEKPTGSNQWAFLFSGCCTQSAANHVPLSVDHTRRCRQRPGEFSLPKNSPSTALADQVRR